MGTSCGPMVGVKRVCPIDVVPVFGTPNNDTVPPNTIANGLTETTVFAFVV